MRLSTLFCVLALSTMAHATERPGRAGLGIMLGEPTGLSGKLFFNNRNAVDAGLSFSFLEERFRVHSDYLIHTSGPDNWSPYFGVGGELYIKNEDDKKDEKTDDRIGVRVPVGIAYQSARHSVDVFFEIVPGMSILPETRLIIGGAIGARYYF